MSVYRRQMGVKRVTALLLLTGTLILAGTYLAIFHHPPASVILDNNRKQLPDAKSFNLDPSRPHTIAEISKAAWGKWLYDNKYTSIGDLYDSSCEDKEKVLIGQVILLPDPTTGGVQARIYINTTLENSARYGTIAVLVHYQGRELYNNKLDMCTAEKGDDVQILRCPLERGVHYFVKEVKVSPLLPKGEYSLKSSVVDQSNDTLLCADMLFKL